MTPFRKKPTFHSLTSTHILVHSTRGGLGQVERSSCLGYCRHWGCTTTSQEMYLHHKKNRTSPRVTSACVTIRLSYNAGLFNADLIIRVKINVNNYLPNAENSIIRGVIRKMPLLFKKLKTVWLLLMYLYNEPGLFYLTYVRV
jgi:hypothetical protein